MEKYKLPRESKEICITHVKMPAVYDGTFCFSEYFWIKGEGVGVTCGSLPDFPLMGKQ